MALKMSRYGSLLFLFACIWGSSGLAPTGLWDTFNLAPKSKTVYPVAINATHGAVTHANLLVNNAGRASLTSSGSWIALDFGIEVGGLISLNLNNAPLASTFSLSFTESPLFIRPTASDDSSYPTSNTTYDGVLRITVPAYTSYWIQPSATLRGGYRYLTIVSNSASPLIISNISCAISFVPHLDDMRAYAGYFYATDPLSKDANFLTKAWYAGAYTVQTNTVTLNSGREVPFAAAGSWYNNATLGVAGPIIVDGAKRDRAVWPGDMGIAVPSQFVSTNDLLPTRNALSTMFAAINPATGALPESGPPLSQLGSDTYHAWTLIGTYNYYLFSGDTVWLQTVWTNYTKAVAFLEGKVDETGLMNVTGLRDWARLGGGGYNVEGNAILYKVLTTAKDLAAYLNDTSLSAAWAQNATALKQKFNTAFWLENVGMYRDNQTTTLCPQDGNSFAVLFNLTTSLAQAQRVSDGLQKNWNELGPVAPELPDTISPFISGFEVQAHFEAENDARALDLIRRTWGYMLYTKLSVQSTLLEGFTANGSIAYRYYRGYNDDAAYTSHSHGWSSGATPALTFYVLGLTVTSPQGKTWSVAPHVGGGLPGAQGSFETGLGTFSVQWTLKGEQFRLDINTPKVTTGLVTIPSSLRGKEYLLDGVLHSAQESQIIPLDGGKHSLVVIL
ncbi:Six-hairpin glycosidase [Gymnopilus junonius]|uniref:Six-hairpin glycosidase n=1 Tax=Gymnopilus junonius TaxID=109634 RepID=A0A9P5TKS7_GYMJU|nr:Six-hairpin glycosidase [Gymnopilus junonius]